MIAVEFAPTMVAWCRLRRGSLEVLAFQQPRRMPAWFLSIPAAKREAPRSEESPGFSWVRFRDVLPLGSSTQYLIGQAALLGHSELVLPKEPSDEQPPTRAAGHDPAGARKSEDGPAT